MQNQNDTPKPDPAEQPIPSGLDGTACCALLEIIAEIEKGFFRTTDDAGAHRNVMMIHNVWRAQAGLEPLRHEDLPWWDAPAGKYRMPPKSRLLHNSVLSPPPGEDNHD